jgi:hypothetical protein
MTLPAEADRPQNPLFTRRPNWGEPATPLVGPAPQGPDYSQARPPQPSESPDLLPTFPGSLDERAQQNRAAVRHGDYPRAMPRLDPYLTLWQPIVFSATSTQNIVSLGKPSKGWRWIIRQLAVLPGDVISSGGGAGLTVHWYVGNMPPVGQFPALSDWIFSTPTTATLTPPQSNQFTSDVFQVQDNQNLIAFIVGSTGGFTSLVKAAVKQVTDFRATSVSEV